MCASSYKHPPWCSSVAVCQRGRGSDRRGPTSPFRQSSCRKGLLSTPSAIPRLLVSDSCSSCQGGAWPFSLELVDGTSHQCLSLRSIGQFRTFVADLRLISDVLTGEKLFLGRFGPFWTILAQKLVLRGFPEQFRPFGIQHRII